MITVLKSPSTRIGLAVAYGTLLVIVDTVATVIALPALVADLDTTLVRGSWATTGYLLGVISAIPVTSWLADRFGERNVYLTGLLVFTGFGFAAGMSNSIEMLIGLRFLQGIGGGTFPPVGSAIALRSVAQERRGAMMAILGLPLLLGPTVGPVALGLLVDLSSWRWLFWITLPLGALAYFMCMKVLPAPEHSVRTRRLDWQSLLYSIPGFAAVLLATTSIDGSGHLTVQSLLVLLAGAILIYLFVRRSLRIPSPLLRIDLLRHRPTMLAAGVVGLFTAGYFGGSLILPTYVQVVRGDPVSVAGTLAALTGLTVGVTVQISTRLLDRYPTGWIIPISVGITTTGTLLLGILVITESPYWTFTAANLVIGIGAGGTLMPAMATASRPYKGTALLNISTLLSLIQQIGTAIGTALIAAALTIAVSVEVSAPPGLERVVPPRKSGSLDRDEPSLPGPLDPLALTVGGVALIPATLLLFATVLAILMSRSDQHRSHIQGS